MQVPSFSPRSSPFARAAVWTLIVTFLVPGGLALPRRAAADNAIQTILKDAFYGGAAGLLLGGVLMLVVDKDSRDDTLRWGAVIGTFSGFAYGIYDTQKGSGDYSGLLHRTAPRERSTGGSDSRDAELAAWADRLRLTPRPGSPLAATLDPPATTATAVPATCSVSGREP